MSAPSEGHKLLHSLYTTITTYNNAHEQSVYVELYVHRLKRTYSINILSLSSVKLKVVPIYSLSFFIWMKKTFGFRNHNEINFFRLFIPSRMGVQLPHGWACN